MASKNPFRYPVEILLEPISQGNLNRPGRIVETSLGPAIVVVPASPALGGIRVANNTRMLESLEQFRSRAMAVVYEAPGSGRQVLPMAEVRARLLERIKP